MEEWGKPAPPAPPPPPVAAPAGGTGIQPATPPTGFRAAFNNLVARKLSELTGQKWANASERARKAEAARRGAKEMAKRIERQTGKRPQESTIRRAARQDRTPRGADQKKLARQARIDAAGGIKKFAQKAGINARKVSRWLAGKATLTLGALRVTAHVTGVLIANGEPYPRDVTVILFIYPPAADDIRAAYAADEWDTIGEMIGPVIAEQVDWAGEAERSFQVEEIHSLTLD
jgi:hypothetical protein